MTLVGFKSQNHPQQKTKPEVDDRATAPEVFDPLNRRFRFSIDVAASQANTKCERFYTVDDDGLAQSWADERVWCNPPFSNIRPWVAKAWAEVNARLIVMLLPANRTEQKFWQELVEPKRDRGEGFQVEFMPGRPRFICVGENAVKPNQRPPFGLCLLIWTRR